MAADGSLSHRIQLPGHRDEFRELADAFDAMSSRGSTHTSPDGSNSPPILPRAARAAGAITQTLLEVARDKND